MGKTLFGIDLGTDILAFLFFGGILVAIFLGIVDLEFTLNFPVTILSIGVFSSGKSIVTNVIRAFKGII